MKERIQKRPRAELWGTWLICGVAETARGNVLASVFGSGVGEEVEDAGIEGFLTDEIGDCEGRVVLLGRCVVHVACVVLIDDDSIIP